MKIIVTGRPVPAVRMTQRSKFKSKQAAKYLTYKNTIGRSAKARMAADGVEQMQSDVEVSAIAYLDPSERDVDVDNLAKAYLDGLNGVAWIDDKQVMKLTVEKRWVFKAGEQRSEIEIKELDSA